MSYALSRTGPSVGEHQRIRAVVCVISPFWAFLWVTTSMKQLNYGGAHPDPCKQ